MHKIAVRWLVAQLKVNLRPLWAPTIQSLGTLVPALEHAPNTSCRTPGL
ncbi:hypothetical protein RSAG8_10597, partial [Rhizoctonia solani AG-8 WAC10335]